MEKTRLCVEVKILHNLIRQKLWSDPQTVSDGKLVGGRGYILRFLAENQDKPIFQRDIEKAFKLRRSTITATLNRMEKNGLIKRSSVDFDSRLKKIKLTDDGIKMHLSFQTRADTFEDEVASFLTAKEKEEFLKIIKKLQKNIEEKPI